MILAYVFSVAAFVGLPLSVFAPLGMAPLVGVTAFASLLAMLRRPGGVALPPLPLLGLTAIFCLWAVASAAWAIDPVASLLTAAQLVGVAVGSLTLVTAARSLTEDERRVVTTGLMVGLVLGLVLLAVDMRTDAALTRFVKGGFRLPLPLPKGFYPVKADRGATVLSLAALPSLALLLATGRRLAAAALLALAAFAIFSSYSLSSKVGLSVGTLALLLALRWPEAMRRGLAAALVLAFLLAPPLAHALPDPQWTWQTLPLVGSLHHRLTIWRFTAERVFERPMIGWGMDAARVIPGGREQIEVSRADPISGQSETITEPLMPLHPHNAVLQIWLELGGIGAALALAWALIVLGRLRDNAAGLALFASGATMSCVSYGVWQSWWLSSLGLAASLVTAVCFVPNKNGMPCRR